MSNPIKKGNTTWCVSVPEEVDARLRAFLIDPYKGRVAPGMISKFVTEAVLDKLKKAESVDLIAELSKGAL